MVSILKLDLYYSGYRNKDRKVYTTFNPKLQQQAEKSIANGFGYEIEERFHDYEYDTDCIDWKFIEFENAAKITNANDQINVTKKLSKLKPNTAIL